MRTLPVAVVVAAVVVTVVLTKEEVKDTKAELQPHDVIRRSPGRRSRERSNISYGRYGCLTCPSPGRRGGRDYGYGYGGGNSHYGGWSRGRYSGGRSRGGRGRYSGGRSRGGRGRYSGGRSRGGRSHGRRSHGGRSYGRRRHGYDSSEESWEHDQGSSCRCPFLPQGPGTWGRGGVGGLGSVEYGDSQTQGNGYYRQWFQAFSNHPCCGGRQGLITSYQRTRSRGYGVQ